MGCQGSAPPKSSPIPARRGATATTSSKAGPAPPERLGLLTPWGVWHLEDKAGAGAAGAQQRLPSEGVGDFQGLLQRQREHRRSHGRKALRHKPQDSPCLPCFCFPQRVPSARTAKALGQPRGVWSPDVTGREPQGMLQLLQHQGLLRAVSSGFKN